MVQGDRSAGPEAYGDRRSLHRQLRSHSAPPVPSTRDTDPAPASRSRQPRPVRISFEDPKGSSPFGFRTSAISWTVLLGGMLLAVVGVVHASWPSAKDQEAAPSIAEDVLNKQIAQLKVELDKERAEKTELIEKIAAVKNSAPAPEPAAPVQTVTQTTSASETQAPADEPSLPQPMAPSVELLLSDVPLNSVPVSSEMTSAEPTAYGIHLASFADRTMAERGWLLLQRNHSAALGQLKPRIDEAKDDQGNPVFLLIAGPFDTEEMAAAHCKKINTQVVFCKPRPFSGSEVAAAVGQ